jgi:hypothetical protein
MAAPCFLRVIGWPDVSFVCGSQSCALMRQPAGSQVNGLLTVGSCLDDEGIARWNG